VKNVRTTPDGPDRPTVLLRAEKLVGGGRALAHHDGATWLVAGALPGELVAARPARRRAGIVEADTVDVRESANPARDPDPCPHADRCGGCDWPHVEPEAGARLKASAASEAARGHPALAAVLATAPVVASPLGYRLRARLHWDPTNRTLGFFEFRSRRVTPIPSCRIVSPDLVSVLPTIAGALANRCPQPVDVEWLQGSETGVYVAGLRSTPDGPRRIDPSWIPDRADVAGAVAGFHSLDRSGEVRAGWGAASVVVDLPVPLTVPIGAFFQGNRHLIRTLFDRVGELAGSDADPVFDLHAGVGFLAAAVLSAGRRDAFLVEPHRVAARAAALNLPAATVAVGQTAEAFVAGADLTAEALVITDPPRSGMTGGLRRDLVRWRPRRVLMLGCDPATWARDAADLCDNGYRVTSVELFDLFPSTHHVEILALLERM
jgi:tRNA/tmRNA/rRNA uracil-C5-methylase (TrmA/RlmC/RlmD family)